MTFTCLMTKPLSNCTMPLVGPIFCCMTPPTCNEGNISSLLLYFNYSEGIHFLVVMLRVFPHNNMLGVFLGNA